MFFLLKQTKFKKNVDNLVLTFAKKQPLVIVINTWA